MARTIRKPREIDGYNVASYQRYYKTCHIIHNVKRIKRRKKTPDEYREDVLRAKQRYLDEIAENGGKMVKTIYDFFLKEYVQREIKFCPPSKWKYFSVDYPEHEQLNDAAESYRRYQRDGQLNQSKRKKSFKKMAAKQNRHRSNVLCKVTKQDPDLWDEVIFPEDRDGKKYINNFW